MKYSDFTNNKNLNNEGFLHGASVMFLGDGAKVAQSFAGLLAKIIKKRQTRDELELWNSIPTISINAETGDVVKDFSISSHGQVGVVVEIRDVKKRNGNIVTSVEFVFVGHTNLKESRTRKIEFKK